MAYKDSVLYGRPSLELTTLSKHYMDVSKHLEPLSVKSSQWRANKNDKGVVLSASTLSLHLWTTTIYCLSNCA